MLNPTWVDGSDPSETPATDYEQAQDALLVAEPPVDDWAEPWAEMARILGDEEPMPTQPPDRPDHPDRWQEFDAAAAWEAWEWVRTAPRALRKEATR
jgi:hypothetical protein